MGFTGRGCASCPMAINRDKLENIHRIRKSAIAYCTGINLTTVDARIDAGLFVPVDESGKWFDLTKCVQAELKARSARGQGKVVSIEAARLKRAQAERVELQNAVERGELVRRDAVEVEYADTVATIVAMLDGLGSRLASQVAELTDVLAITTLIDAELNEIKTTAAARFKATKTAR